MAQCEAEKMERTYSLVVTNLFDIFFDGIVCSTYFTSHNSCFGLTTHNSMKAAMCLLSEKEAITLVYLNWVIISGFPFGV
jgi:hypothetical protein